MSRWCFIRCVSLATPPKGNSDLTQAKLSMKMTFFLSVSSTRNVKQHSSQTKYLGHIPKTEWKNSGPLPKVKSMNFNNQE